MDEAHKFDALVLIHGNECFTVVRVCSCSRQHQVISVVGGNAGPTASLHSARLRPKHYRHIPASDSDNGAGTLLGLDLCLRKTLFRIESSLSYIFAVGKQVVPFRPVVCIKSWNSFKTREQSYCAPPVDLTVTTSTRSSRF
ncbi:hypothetical protein M378DRAFT_322105 [Amanita muscaria Koide BX008]|uniref:Uncharacterized protein n=1 Tax=Amanita muscaria (strain Koide BX008) TaxID=946122 RepID=A0A0C2XC80_AMAMK|nr:hypothetical protein M378DRAFT_322105 [Amanita muscaria Koide BX008]